MGLPDVLHGIAGRIAWDLGREVVVLYSNSAVIGGRRQCFTISAFRFHHSSFQIRPRPTAPWSLYGLQISLP
jgi:hypothetical protein